MNASSIVQPVLLAGEQNVREVCSLFEYRSLFKNIEKEATTTSLS